jgi:hypothetical protein
MIIQLKEHEGCFAFELTPETTQDAALIVRLGINATKEVRHLSAAVNSDGTFGGTLVLGKHKAANNHIPRRQ